MAHLVRVLPDSKWKRGLKVSGAVMRDIDHNTVDAMNGDGGGTYAPSSPIVVGGAGIVFATQWDLVDAATVESDGADKPISFDELSVADAFKFGPSHSATTSRLVATGIKQGFAIGRQRDIYVDYDTTSKTATYGVRTQVPGARFLTTFPAVHGATLQSAILRWRVTQAHANPPAQRPRVRVVRISDDGVMEGLRSQGDGFQELAALGSTGADWYNGGATQSFSYITNQLNVIDMEKYSYFAEIICESGANAFTPTGTPSTTGNLYLSIIGDYVYSRLDQKD